MRAGAGLITFMFFLSCFGAPAWAACAVPEFCRSDLERIEAAYASALEKAGDAEGRAAGLRLRNVGLAALVERTYESMLAGMTDRRDLLQAMEDDQGKWLKQLEAISAGDPGVERLEEVSRFLLERLHVFGVLLRARERTEKDGS